MSVSRIQGGLTTQLTQMLLQRHRFHAVLPFVFFLTAAPLFAQPPASQDRTQVYLAKYAEQLARLQEAKFSYSGSFTRSVPSKGVAARWESSGTIRISAARKSLHRTSSTTLVEIPGDASFARRDLGIEELLITPDTSIGLTILNDANAPPSDEHFQVDTKTEKPDNEWSRALADHELGTILGYAPVGCEDRSLSDVVRSGPCSILADQIVDSKSLSGFLANPGDLEVRALFDPLNRDELTQLKVAHLVKTPKVDELLSVSVNVMDIQHADAEPSPSSFRLKITVERSGGSIPRPDIPNVVEKADTIEIEPQTWDYDYEVSDIVYQEPPQGNWFALDHEIPNGAMVIVDGDRNLPHTWKNGKVGPLLGGVRKNVDSAEFQRSQSSNRIPLLIGANLMIAVVLLALRIVSKSRRQG